MHHRAFILIFQITHMEMIKGIQGHGYYDELVVPIIENTAQERELTESLAAAVCSFFLSFTLFNHFNLQVFIFDFQFFLNDQTD